MNRFIFNREDTDRILILTPPPKKTAINEEKGDFTIFRSVNLTVLKHRRNLLLSWSFSYY